MSGQEETVEDLKCAASIMAAGVFPLRVKVRRGWYVFVFPPEATALAAGYVTGELMVSAKEVFRRHAQLWDIVKKSHMLPTECDDR